MVWRAETGFRHDADSSAADVVRYEQETLGNSLGIPPPLLLELDTYPACALLWVAFTRENALRYGDAADIKAIRLDVSAHVIAADGEGGYLLFFSDDLTQPAGGGAMADHFNDDPAAQVRREINKAERSPKDAVPYTIPSSAGEFVAFDKKTPPEMVTIAPWLMRVYIVAGPASSNRGGPVSPP
jgi:hypothetical protein